MSNPFGLLINEEDCNECFCMVCARNKSNNVVNKNVKKDCERCNCNYGDKLVGNQNECFGKGFVA